MALPATANFTGTNDSEVRSLTDWDGALTDLISGGACDIQSNQARASASGTIGADWYTSETFDANQYAEATVKAITSGVYIGVAVRCSGTDNAGNLTGYLFYSDSADGCYIDKIVSGSFVASIAGAGTAFAVNDVIRLEINGSALTAKVNGATRLTATDTAISSGRPGIAAYSTGASAIDDWTAGNVSSGSATIAPSFISAGSTLYNPTVSRGAVTVAPNHLASTATLYNPTIRQGQTVAPAFLSASSTLYNPTVGRGTVTVAPAYLSASSTLYSPTVTVGANIAPNFIASGATLYAPTVNLKIYPGSVASTATIYQPTVKMSACINGVLSVNATNPRYFQNDDGILVLTGFHTWQVSGAENSPTDPPQTFDFDEFIAALGSYGVNYTKLWAMETPEDWPNLSPMYFAPLPWQRTGPGNAADGKPKFDLTAFDQNYFDQMRNYAVRLGNAGIYVAVQIFQGWHASLKGFSTGDPVENHPFNSGNNVNSVDADINNNGDVLELYNTSNTAIWNLQKAYIDKVIATVGDLDNVIWEVANEIDYSSTALAWARSVAAYLLANDSNNHPIGITKFWPGGDNSYLFDSADADWISIDDDYPTPIPDEADGSKVIIYDTDHIQGLTDQHAWIWQSFCMGNNPAYMDEWNGWTYGTDKRNTTANIKIRANLGYIQNYAARMDLANSTPQPSLSSTGYAIAKTTGAAKILIYQSNTSGGSFSAYLTGISGEFSLEWLRVTTGATQAGSNVTGGATRTLTPPWAEDAVAFLEKLQDLIEPAYLSASSTLYNPTVGRGTVTVSPAYLSASSTLYSPVITAGSVTVFPSHLASTAQVFAPVVSSGSLIVVPTYLASTAQVFNPTVSPGSVTVAPNYLSATSQLYAPVITTAITVTPAVITSTVTVYNPTVTGGTTTIVAGFIASTAELFEPTVSPGSVTVAPNYLSATSQLYAPVVTSGMVIAPEAIASSIVVFSHQVAPGAVTIAPAHLASSAHVFDPLIQEGTDRTIEPAFIASSLTVYAIAAVTMLNRRRIARVGAEVRNFVVNAENRTFTID